MKGKEQNAFYLDALAHIGMGISLGMGAEYFGVLATRYGATAYILAIISSAPFVTNLFAPMWSQQSKQWGAKRLMVISLIFSGAILILMIPVHDPLIFALFALLFFLFYGVGDPLYVVLADKVYGKNSGTNMGKTEGVFSLAHAMAATAVGRLFDLFGAVVAFAGSAIGSILAAIAYLFFPEPPTQADPDGKGSSSPATLFRNDPSIRQLVFFFMVPGIGMVLMLPALPIVEVKLARLSNFQIGILFGVNNLTWFLFSVIWGKMVDRQPHVFSIFQISFISMAMMALLYAYFFNFYALLIANILCGIGGPGIAVGWRAQALRFKKYAAEDLAGLHLFTCGIRGLIFPFLGAWMIHQWNTRFNLLVSAILLMSGVLLFQIYKKLT